VPSCGQRRHQPQRDGGFTGPAVGAGDNNAFDDDLLDRKSGAVEKARAVINKLPTPTFKKNSKFQHSNFKEDTNQRLIVTLISPEWMIGMSCLSHQMVWDFNFWSLFFICHLFFGYCDFFAIFHHPPSKPADARMLRPAEPYRSG
jgi:hypothetical protein